MTKHLPPPLQLGRSWPTSVGELWRGFQKSCHCHTAYGLCQKHFDLQANAAQIEYFEITRRNPAQGSRDQSAYGWVIVAIFKAQNVCARTRPVSEELASNTTSVLTKRMPCITAVFPTRTLPVTCQKMFLA